MSPEGCKTQGAGRAGRARRVVPVAGGRGRESSAVGEVMAVSGLLRLAEAAGVLSLATDLAMGQPLEHGLRTAVLAVRVAAGMVLPEGDRVTVFYTSLLHFAGCTAEGEI